MLPLRNLLCVCACTALHGQTLGVFEANGDIGVAPKTGKVEFDGSKTRYRVTGGGANVWAMADAFHFAWKQVTGDFALTADVQFEGAGTAAHRKAMLMVRQGLEPDAAYADVALHGDGLTALQYRPTSGALTQEVRSALKGPLRLRIERHGNAFTMFVGAPGEKLEASGPVTVELRDPVYAGIGLCSHNADVLDSAIFSGVAFEAMGPQAQRSPTTSHIQIYDLKTKKSHEIYTSEQVFEAPNWSRDGKYLLVNSRGKLWKLPVAGGEPQPVDTGTVNRVNNDHGISPDGSLFALSAGQIYTVPAAGGAPRQLTNATPSYYHGWSPDGKRLAFVGLRDGNFDLYDVPAEGGEERRLTSHPAYDDGPDYSRDGKWIYFNSDRSGSWDIWRIPAGGAGLNDAKAERITDDELEDWFPHPSPDGKWMVVISFPKGTKGHPANQNVKLRVAPMPGDRLRKVTPAEVLSFLGGQGTINVNSWAPDSRAFAYVSYTLR